MSGEHIVSESLFSAKTIEVSGMSWCRDEPKRISVPRFVTNRLCRHHNTALSPVDAEAKRFFDLMDRTALIDSERKRTPPMEWVTKVLTYKVSGPLIERWLLKTLINVVVTEPGMVGPNATEDEPVDPQLVSIAFGRDRFTGPRGLYGVAVLGEKLTGAREWTLQLLGQGRVVGVLAQLRTFRFGLCLIERPLPKTITHIDEWRGARTWQPFDGINLNIGPFPSQHIAFDWSDAASST
jgi:hypothetical protein